LPHSAQSTQDDVRMGRSQEDIKRVSFWRAVVSEFVGTAFLLMIGCGTWTDTDHREHAWTVKVTIYSVQQ